MLKLAVHAVRNGNTIEVTVSGHLPNSCHTAKIEDIYPGGSRVYITDPGAAQVFVNEAVKPGSDLCLMMLMPWAETVSIPDKNHKKVEIFVNNHEVLEVSVVESTSKFIVIAVTGTKNRCSIVPKDARYLAIYSKVYGPGSHDECKAWVSANCE